MAPVHHWWCYVSHVTLELASIHGITNTPNRATFIPAVRALFRRPRHEREASNNTEYAFFKSKSLITRILDSAHRPGIATVAFFVFAVMYVFSNEVTLRVARTVSKRLKRLSSKVERGEEELNEDDLKLLQGWRWRVLLWK